MGPTVLAEFKRLSERHDVHWVQYRGHVGNFAVKLKNDGFYYSSIKLQRPG